MSEGNQSNQIKLHVIGQIFGSSGYSMHTRQLVNALYKEGVEIKLETALPQGWLSKVNDAELEMIDKQHDKEMITLMIGMPHYYRNVLNDTKKFIGFVVWEGDKVPKFWIPYLEDERIKQIWVPSQHTRDAILNTAPEKREELIKKIRIVPHGYDPSIFYPNPKSHDKFVFVCNKGWRGNMYDRGGVQYLLKAFAEEFKSNEDVELMIKINPAYAPNLDINKAVEQLNLPKDHAEIKVSKDLVELDKIPTLYHEGDVFVAPSRCEAFGLPILEAMGCGLPIITTNFGGQVDFVPAHNKFIGGKLEEVKWDVMYEGIKWLTPSIKELRKAMREWFENRDGLKEIGLKNHQHALNNYTWKHAAKRAIEYLKEIN